MKKRLTDAERAYIEAMYGAKCNLTHVRVCKPGAVTPHEQTLTKRQRRMRESARKAGKNGARKMESVG